MSTLALFALELDSELLFVGDAGNTEASGASRRIGLEWTNHYRPAPWLAFDLDVALTRARFRDAPGADRIPGSIDRAISAGMSFGNEEGWHATVRARHFGPRVLTEDGSIRGRASLTCNARIGWRRDGWDLALDVLNVFDRDDNDIEYVYESRLPGEPDEGVTDTHLHPAEPVTWRVTLTRRF